MYTHGRVGGGVGLSAKVLGCRGLFFVGHKMVLSHWILELESIMCLQSCLWDRVSLSAVTLSHLLTWSGCLPGLFVPPGVQVTASLSLVTPCCPSDHPPLIVCPPPWPGESRDLVPVPGSQLQSVAGRAPGQTYSQYT